MVRVAVLFLFGRMIESCVERDFVSKCVTAVGIMTASVEEAVGEWTDEIVVSGA